MMKLPSAGLTVALWIIYGSIGFAQPVVPGTGEKLANVGDDFEDPQWTYIGNFPKASDEQDGQSRLPTGKSANGRWFEPTLRGQPDYVKRVATPEGGLEGSTGALALRTLQSGVPRRPSNKRQQDDLIANVASRIGGFIPVSRSPNVVVRVYVPPFHQWEQRSGNSFGFRAAVEAPDRKSRGRGALETYWPGIFIYFNSKTDRRNQQDSATILFRGNELGHEITGPRITEPGWWTLGMSFTPDGRVHYYASPGVDDLTPQDLRASTFPYGFRCQRFKTFFFDVLNHDDNQSWSTQWIIDDPALYFIRR